MQKMQLISIQILNSQYKILFNLFLCVLIYACFYGNKSLSFCMNENTDNIDWKKLYFASETKKSELQTQIQIIQNENLDLSLENFSLRSEVKEQQILRTREIKRISELEKENLNLKQMLLKENTTLKRTLGELVANHFIEVRPQVQPQGHTNLTTEMSPESAAAKTEIQASPHTDESAQDIPTSENLSKRSRHL